MKEETKQEIDMSKYIVGIDPYDKQELELEILRLEKEKISYSEEEVLGILVKAIKDVKVKRLTFFDGGSEYPIYSNLSKWFEQFKKK